MPEAAVVDLTWKLSSNWSDANACIEKDGMRSVFKTRFQHERESGHALTRVAWDSAEHLRDLASRPGQHGASGASASDCGSIVISAGQLAGRDTTRKRQRTLAGRAVASGPRIPRTVTREDGGETVAAT